MEILSRLDICNVWRNTEPRDAVEENSGKREATETARVKRGRESHQCGLDVKDLFGRQEKRRAPRPDCHAQPDGHGQGALLLASYAKGGGRRERRRNEQPVCTGDREGSGTDTVGSSAQRRLRSTRMASNAR